MMLNLGSFTHDEREFFIVGLPDEKLGVIHIEIKGAGDFLYQFPAIGIDSPYSSIEFEIAGNFINLHFVAGRAGVVFRARLPIIGFYLLADKFYSNLDNS